jgi:phosphohistidine phosphatase SixA
MGFSGTIRMERALYDAPGDIWLAALRVLPAAADSALVVAHSPGIAQAAALLCGAVPDAFDVPTAGLLAFDDRIERWRDLDSGNASLRWFLRPKLLEQL